MFTVVGQTYAEPLILFFFILKKTYISKMTEHKINCAATIQRSVDSPTSPVPLPG